jgi:glycosyltransferase involved in cell wall biosynthesis
MKLVLYRRTISGIGGEERLLLMEYLFLKKKGIDVKFVISSEINLQALQAHLNEEQMKLLMEDLILIRCRNELERMFLLRKTLLTLKPDLIRTNGQLPDVFVATRFTRIPYVLNYPSSVFWFVETCDMFALIYRKNFGRIMDSEPFRKDLIYGEQYRFGLVRRLQSQILGIFDILSVKKSACVLVHTQKMSNEMNLIYGKIPTFVGAGAINGEMLSRSPFDEGKLAHGWQDKIVLLSASRLAPKKRVGILVRALSKLLETHDNLLLVIVGTGPDEEKLRALTNSLKIQNHVIFLGNIPDSELWNLYDVCDIFLSPDCAEYDISPFEALARNKIVIWSSEMDPNLIQDPRILVSEPTVDAYAAKIETALKMEIDDPKTIDLTDFIWDNYFQRLLKLYLRIVSNSNDTGC